MIDVFCGQCGVQAADGNFCRNCGAPLVGPEGGPDAPPATPPGAPFAATPQYSTTAAAPMVNPFAGVPLTDFARDLGALILLFGALALPWDAFNEASGLWWVVLATVISALSIGVPFLVTLGLINGWGAAQSRLVKYVAAVPYLVSVLVVVINELVHLNDPGEGAIGAAVGVGLAGALLAAQPRALDEEPTGAADGAWRKALLVVFGGGIALLTVTTLIDMVTTLSDTDQISALIGITVLLLTSFSVVLAVPFIGLLNGGREWGRVLAAAGFAVVVTQFLGAASDQDPLFQALLFEQVKSVVGVFIVAAGVALLVSRPIQRRLMALPAVGSWVLTARNAFVVLGVALALSALGRLLILIGFDQVDATGVVTLIGLVLAAGAAFVASAMLARNPDQARKVVLGILGGIVLLAIIAISVGRGGDSYAAISLTPGEVVGWFALPALIAFALLYPPEIRRTFTPILGTPPVGGYQAPSAGFEQPQAQMPPQDSSEPPMGS